MSKRAEEKALEAYPHLEQATFDEMYPRLLFTRNTERNAFVQGYEQAEKDLGWISVEDRLPEESGFYITCVEQSGVAQCVSVDNYFDVKRKEWIEDDEDNCIAAVDYWMPMPKLPKEDEK